MGKMVATKSVFSSGGALFVSAPQQTAVSTPMPLPQMALLSSICQIINDLIVQFVQGEKSAPLSTLTASYYESLAQQLYDLQLSSSSSSSSGGGGGYYAYYEVIRKQVANSLQNLYMAINLYNQNCGLETQLSALQTIVSDTDKIMQYVDAMSAKNQTAAFLFPETSIQIIAAEIKPQIKTYIALYGIPPNGIFDPDKLAAIR